FMYSNGDPLPEDDGTPYFEMTGPEGNAVTGSVVAEDVDGDDVIYQLDTVNTDSAFVSMITLNPDGSFSVDIPGEWRSNIQFFVLADDQTNSATSITQGRVDILVEDQNDAPTGIDLTGIPDAGNVIVDENENGETVIGTLDVIDPDTAADDNNVQKLEIVDAAGNPLAPSATPF